MQNYTCQDIFLIRTSANQQIKRTCKSLAQTCLCYWFITQPSGWSFSTNVCRHMCHAAKHSWPEEFDVQLSDPFKGHVNALFVLLMSDLSFRPHVRHFLPPFHPFDQRLAVALKAFRGGWMSDALFLHISALLFLSHPCSCLHDQPSSASFDSFIHVIRHCSVCFAYFSNVSEEVTLLQLKRHVQME